MYSFAVIHESRNLKQARPNGQYVDLLRFMILHFTLATPSWDFLDRCYHASNILSRIFTKKYIIIEMLVKLDNTKPNCYTLKKFFLSRRISYV